MRRKTVNSGLTIGQIDRVIHEPARFALMAHLSIVEEADFVYLVRQKGLSAGNAGAHLKKLEGAGYVSVTKTFVDNRPQTMYSITERGRQALSVHRETMYGLLAAVED
jgi:DNA-binding MarR family transcriptional regulator